MPLLSEMDIAGARAVFLSTLTQSCLVRHWQGVEDNEGAQLDTYADGDTYPCRVNAGRLMRTDQIPGQVAAVQYVQIALPYDADVRDRARIIVGTHTYDLMRPIPQTVSVCLLLECQEIF